MKRMMLLFALALCLAGCTAQTRIERVQMPVPAAESIAAEDATTEGEEEAYPNEQSISSPTKTIRETVELGQEDTEPEPVSCPVCGGEMVTQQEDRAGRMVYALYRSLSAGADGLPARHPGAKRPLL